MYMESVLNGSMRDDVLTMAFLRNTHFFRAFPGNMRAAKAPILQCVRSQQNVGSNNFSGPTSHHTINIVCAVKLNNERRPAERPRIRPTLIWPRWKKMRMQQKVFAVCKTCAT